LLGARFVLPFPADASPLYLPILRFARTKELAYASSSRAAFHLARGRRDSAETALREVVSYGFKLLDDSNIALETLVGTVIVDIARDQLIRFYDVTRNPAGARLRARYDSLLAAQNAAEAERPSPGDERSDLSDPIPARRSLIQVVRDPRMPRGIRMATLTVLGLLPCTNVRELVLGLDQDIRATFAYARDSLARFPSERALVDLQAEAVERTGRERQRGIGPRLFVGAADVAGAVLRNRRLPGCARLLAALM
ncbi:MAG TPA: hypothetical protein VNL18_03495, partial [Gemmatimonadales bacterium]|nr:hypothetical protein [Gemmatimonadales bacterium]